MDLICHFSVNAFIQGLWIASTLSLIAFNSPFQRTYWRTEMAVPLLTAELPVKYIKTVTLKGVITKDAHTQILCFQNKTKKRRDIFNTSLGSFGGYYISNIGFPLYQTHRAHSLIAALIITNIAAYPANKDDSDHQGNRAELLHAMSPFFFSFAVCISQVQPVLSCVSPLFIISTRLCRN